MVAVEIDPLAGFCPGVNRAINTADNLLKQSNSVYSLGELVHCPEELARLGDSGLNVISIDDLRNINNADILIRAHGVTPEIQHRLEISNNNIVDATCGIVHRLQQKIKTTNHEMQARGGQIVIFGKRKHPEVVSLLGYCNNQAIVVERADDFSDIILSKPLSIFAQTTTNVADYELFIVNLFHKLELEGISSNEVQVYNTICGSIKVRVPKLRLFARKHNVVIFVSGEQSSNGTYLSGICREENHNTYKISSESELKKEWFNYANTIGVTGSASSPVWLLENVASAIKIMIGNSNS